MAARLDFSTPHKPKLNPVTVARIWDEYGLAAVRERWSSWSERHLYRVASEGRMIIQRRRAESGATRQPARGRCGQDPAADLLLDADVGLAPAAIYNPLSSSCAFGAMDVRNIVGAGRAPATHAL